MRIELAQMVDENPSSIDHFFMTFGEVFQEPPQKTLQNLNRQFWHDPCIAKLTLKG